MWNVPDLVIFLSQLGAAVRFFRNRESVRGVKLLLLPVRMDRRVRFTAALGSWEKKMLRNPLRYTYPLLKT